MFHGMIPSFVKKKRVGKDRIKLALRKNSLELHQPYMHIVNRSFCLMSPQVSLARSIQMVLTKFLAAMLLLLQVAPTMSEVLFKGFESATNMFSPVAT